MINQANANIFRVLRTETRDSPHRSVSDFVAVNILTTVPTTIVVTNA